jgi:capsule polysaccharide export protein KpsE/RkpR
MPWQRRMIYTAVFINSLFSVALFFYAIFQCGYYSSTLAFVVKRLGTGCASDSSALGMTFTHAAATMTTDWMFILFPFLLLRHSLMTRKEKITIGSVLAFAAMYDLRIFSQNFRLISY